MGDELDAIGAHLAGHPGHAPDHPGGDSIGIVVGGRHDGLGHDRAQFQVEGDGLGERTPHVDADAQPHDQARAAPAGVPWCERAPESARRCRRAASRGLTTNTWSAPNE